MTDNLQDILFDQLKPEAAFSKLQLVGVELAGNRQHPLVRIYVDKVGGVEVDDCAEVSRKVDERVEAFLVEHGLTGPFVLEVSSPGLNRPLFFREDYVMFQGRMVEIETKAPVNGRKRFKGKLRTYLSASDTVELEDKGGSLAIPFAVIKKAHLDYFASKEA